MFYLILSMLISYHFSSNLIIFYLIPSMLPLYDLLPIELASDGRPHATHPPLLLKHGKIIITIIITMVVIIIIITTITIIVIIITIV